MPDKFKELIRKIKQGDESAISSIRKNIEAIVIHYFSKNNIELDWIAHENGLISQKELYDSLLKSFIDEIKKNEVPLSIFADYKDFIISKSEVRVNRLFNNFYNLLVNNDTKVWLKFDEILKLRVRAWLIKKGIGNDEIEVIYQDAQTVFIEKKGRGDIVFENSRLLKSYLFRIIHLKILESQRGKIALQSLDNFENIIEDNSSHCYITEVDKTEIKQHLFNELSEHEKVILVDVYFHGEKLKDIACKLNITDANCRVIKHRALAKLEETAKKMGYN